jgi:membrane protein
VSTQTAPGGQPLATAREARRLTPGVLFKIVRTTLKEWSEDKVPRLGASLAYYTIFSLAPLLVIAIAIAGLVLDPAEVQKAVLTQMGGLVGQQGAELIGTMIESAQKPATGIIAAVLGVVTLLLGALGAFGQLQDALNTIWEVKPKPGLGLWGLIRTRLLSLSMVLVVGFLLLVSLILSTGISAVGGAIGGLLPESALLLSIVNFVLSLVVITALFALMFKYLPDAEIAWRDVWVGAVITALLFTIGKQLIGLYLGNASITSSYGAAGSLVVLLVWIYYSAQIVLLGAEFTQVYANQFGSKVVPTENAVTVTEEDRAQQGLTRPERAAGQPQALTPAPERALQRTPTALAARSAYLPERQAGDGVIVSLLTFVVGLGAGAILAGQRRLSQVRRQRRSVWRR